MGRVNMTAMRPPTDEERAELERIARARSERADRVGWAKILLAVADGERYADVARMVGRRSPDSVARLVERWNTLGIDALAPKTVVPDAKRATETPKQVSKRSVTATRTRPVKQGTPSGASPLGAGSPLVAPVLHEAMTLPGALAVALVDLPSGIVLERVGGEQLDLDRAGHGNAEVLRAKLRVKERLGIRDEIEDILITLETQYHLLRVVSADTSIFIYFVLEREQAHLAMARRALHHMEQVFSLGRSIGESHELLVDALDLDL